MEKIQKRSTLNKIGSSKGTLSRLLYYILYGLWNVKIVLHCLAIEGKNAKRGES